MEPKEGRTQGVIVSVAHLDDDERALVLGVILDADRTRVVDGMSDLGGDGAMSGPELAKVVRSGAWRFRAAIYPAFAARP